MVKKIRTWKDWQDWNFAFWQKLDDWNWNHGEEVAHFAWFGEPWVYRIFRIFFFIFHFPLLFLRKSAIFQVEEKCTSLVGSRNKLDHSEKKYELPLWLWLCTIENKDLIILVFASFPWYSMKLYQHSDSSQFLNN